MNRRAYLATVCGAGITATAGCSAVAGRRTLSDPHVSVDSPGRKALVFESGGAEVGHLGVDGSVVAGRLELSTEIWHREGTTVDRVRLRVWMPETATESPAKVAVVSPVEGDSSPPPSVALHTPDEALGTVVELSDLDDLADETISTLELLVVPGAAGATALAIDTTIDLAAGGILGRGYTLDGTLHLEYPELDDG
ncbi:hypothetical protein [Haloglomus litoreum]|uniref:hypothetical protein n=1 Tax=Haloglomus litoreum TaxID=3034026 RepID=UPI0023E75567|nr:hypothetical protein [Haloglomus sp. DT116]